MKMTEISKLLRLPISGIWRRIRNKEFPTYEIKDKNGYLVDFTRQQIGDLTGLRVETVIRAIKSLEKKRMLKIINRKVYREI